MEFKIISIVRNELTNLIPEKYKFICIRVGKREYRIDINKLHFRKSSYNNKKVEMFYFIRDEDFDNTALKIGDLDEISPIPIGTKTIPFNKDYCSYSITYDLSLIENYNDNYSNYIEKQEMPSFFIKERSKDFPKVYF